MMRALTIVLVVGCGSSLPPPEPGGANPDADTPSSADAPATDPGHDAALPGSRRIEIYSGDGMMMMGGWPSGDSLKAIVRDGDLPAAGVMVSWQVTDGDTALTGEFQTGATGTSVTDASGIARVGLRGEFLSQMTSAVPATVRASIAEGSIEYTVFATYWTQQIPALPSTYVTAPAGLDLGTHAPNEVIVGGVKALVAFNSGTEAGRGMAGVGVRFTPGNDETVDTIPPVACVNATEPNAGGTVFTDATGTATCDIRVPATPGNYSFGIYVGGASLHSPFFVRVQ